MNQSIKDSVDHEVRIRSIEDKIKKVYLASELNLKKGYCWMANDGSLQKYQNGTLYDCIKVAIPSSGRVIIKSPNIRSIQTYNGEPSATTWLGGASTVISDNGRFIYNATSNILHIGITFYKSDKLDYDNITIITPESENYLLDNSDVATLYQTADYSQLSFIAMGDSSTDGKGSVDKANTSSAWVANMQSILKFKDYRNAAIAGCSCTEYPIGHWNGATELHTRRESYYSNSSHNVVSNQVYSLIRHYNENKGTENEFYPDIIFMQAGGNNLPDQYPDFDWNSYLGDWDTMMYNYQLSGNDFEILNMNIQSEKERYAKLREFRLSMYGAMRWAIEACLYHFPNTTIYIGSPFQRGAKKNKNIFVMRDVMKRVADFYSCQFIDGTSRLGMSFFTEKDSKNSYTYDGTHQNNSGIELVGQFMANEIKKTYLVKPKLVK